MRQVNGSACKRYAIEGFCVIVLLALWLGAMGFAELATWHTVRDFLAGWLALLVGQWLVGERLSGRLWRGSYPVFLLWMFVFPFVLGQSAEGWTLDFDRAAQYYKAALFWGILSALLFSLGRRHLRWRISICGIYGAVTFFLSVIAFSYAGYYFIFHTAFAADDMIPVLQTSVREAEGFLLLHGSAALWLSVAAALLAYGLALIALAWHAMGGEDMAARWKWKLPVVLFACVLLGAQVFASASRGFPFTEYHQAKKFIERVKAAEAAHEENLKGFHLDGNGEALLSRNLPGTVLLVIGESASSGHMSAFAPTHEGMTTPWLSAQGEASGFYVFPKSYSNFPQTVQALGMYLTGVNQYNGRQLTEALSILDVAKKAGYKTWWLSNQDKIGNYDSPAVMVAGWADEERWTSPSMGDDKELLRFLKEIPAEGNHFVVLWLMGSHTCYAERVPKDFPQVQTAGHESVENEYDTTIAYTDEVLKEIFEYARDHMHLQSMLYCSDHGEDMKLGHGAGAFSFDMVRVPLFIYLSPAYQEIYPQTAAALAAHKESVFTNDLMFDTVSGILQAPSREYDAQYDLSSPSYSLPLDKAVTKHGAVKIADDA